MYYKKFTQVWDAVNEIFLSTEGQIDFLEEALHWFGENKF